MLGQSQYRLCIDRVLPISHQAVAVRKAIERNPGNRIEVPLTAEMTRGVNVGVPRIAIVTKKMWPKGDVLKVRFLDGSDYQKKTVEEKAHMWEQFANVTFQFGDAPDAEIRISFQADP